MAPAADKAAKKTCRHLFTKFKCGHNCMISPGDPTCIRSVEEHKATLSWFKPKRVDIICPGCRYGRQNVEAMRRNLNLPLLEVEEESSGFVSDTSGTGDEIQQA